MDRGTWVVLALPLVLALGPWVALVVLIAVAVDAIYHDRLLSAAEKQELAKALLPYRQRFRGLRKAPSGNWRVESGEV